VVDRVFVHIGLPKTATSYLQTIIWSNREALRERGVVVPGAERRDHLWASRTVREERSQERAPERHRTAWERLRAELAATEGTGLVSHEFFAAASAEQAVAMVDALAPAEVHLVLTAREPLGLFTASWQESLKNGATTPMPEYARTVSPRPSDIWNWRTLDLRLVLERWCTAVPAERVHVLVLDPEAPRDDVWERFAGIVGFSTDGIDLSGSFPNTSMGVAEAETLRRVNGRLVGFDNAFDKGVYIRTFLADERLATRDGEKYWPTEDVIAECRRRGEEAVEHIRASSYDVIGDLDDLLVPPVLGPRRPADSVTEAEVAEVATAVIGRMLHDVRRIRTERNELRRELEAERARPVPGLREALATRFPWTRRFVVRS